MRIRRISIDVPDDIYEELRRRGLPISEIVQRAFSAVLAANANAAWIVRARERPIGPASLSTEALMEDVEQEFGG